MRFRALALVALLITVPVWLGFSSQPPTSALGSALPPTETTELRVEGLEANVEILKDLWGISHIYAETEHDLFFAQGYSAARDRLFQFEIWRRQATGTVAEILGEREIERDRGARLFKFRGDLEAELNYYHPRGGDIIRAFVAGINAYVGETEKDPDLLPIEFELLGITPGHWTPEVVISRHQGLLGNIGQELNLGIAVAAVGSEKVKEIEYFHPGEPDIDLDPDVDGALLKSEILDVYRAFRGPIRFRPQDVAAEYRATTSQGGGSAHADDVPDYPGVNTAFGALERSALGSNNWVVSGERTLSGHPIMANDPHRVQAAPSLRYAVHLVGPGWDVIGGGEPVLPGISIGHNQHGAWGLTVFATDAEDLYVYETDPNDSNRYRYQGAWESMRVIEDAIGVKDAGDAKVQHKYTRHGPVVYEDAENHVAYAVRAGWLEFGGAPYLASLRMDQATTWEEFREACNYSNIPGENMVWADKEGNIGWQAVGIAPIRRNWTGLVPVPGDGRYEWDGYLEIKHKPHVFNPAQGFFATANSNLIPPGYEHRDAVGWSWSDPFRFARLGEVLSSGRRFTVSEMMQLATDYVSLPARSLIPMLKGLDLGDPETNAIRDELVDWNRELTPGSRQAAIYVAWERAIQASIVPLVVPAQVRSEFRSVSMKKTIDWLGAPPPWLASLGDGDPVAGRDEFLRRTFGEALDGLAERFGTRPWRYGGEEYKHVRLRHPLSGAVDAAMKDRLEVGPHERGGNGFTVNQTGFGDNQTSGASFRIITEAGDWDTAVFTNTPGQSGDPDHPMYRNLFDGWAKDRFFPLYYTRSAVEAVVADRVVLSP